MKLYIVAIILAYCIVLASGTYENLLKYKKARNLCNRTCRDGQRNYIHAPLDNKDSAKIWRFLYTMGIGRQRKALTTDVDCGSDEYLPSEPSYKNEKTPATTVNVVSENENTLKNDAKQEASQYQQDG